MSELGFSIYVVVKVAYFKLSIFAYVNTCMYIEKEIFFFFFFFFLRMIEKGIIYVTVACLIIFWCRLKKTKGGLGIAEIF